MEEYGILAPWRLCVFALNQATAVHGVVSAVNPCRTKVGFARDGAASDFVKAMVWNPGDLASLRLCVKSGRLK